MAKANGIVKLNGKVGDLVFRKNNGVQIVSRVPKFDRERYEKGESYEVVRKNNKEFGACVKLSATVQKAMPLLKGRGVYTQINNRLTKVLSLLRVGDVGENGGRQRLALTEHPGLLAGFDWTTKWHVSSVLTHLIHVEHSKRRIKITTQNIVVDDVVSSLHKSLKDKYFRVKFVASLIPDLEYDEKKGQYVPMNEGIGGKFYDADTDFAAVGDELKATELVIRLPNMDMSNCTVVLSAMVTFYSVYGMEDDRIYDNVYTGHCVRTLMGWKS